MTYRNPVIISLAGIAVLLAGLAWFRPANLNLPLFPQTSPTPTPITEDENLNKFIEAYEGIQSYQASIVASSSGQTITLDVKHKKPNLTQTVLSDGKDSSEFISTGEATYIKTATSTKWVKLTGAAAQNAPQPSFDFDAFKTDLQNKTANPTYVGEQACGTLNCHVYQDQNPDGSTGTILFDKNDFLVRQIKVDSPTGEQTVMNYGYEPVEIVLPPEEEVYVLPEDPTQINEEELKKILGE